MLTGKLRKALWAILVAFVVLAVLSLAAQFLGLTTEICKSTGGYGDQECERYNIVIAALFLLRDVLNDVSPLVTALATVAIALFTLTLWLTSADAAAVTRQTVDLAEKQFLMEGRQADLAERQHGLARLQHIAANKPRLRIRSVSLERVGGPPNWFFVNGHRVSGSLVVANAGATDATILESDYRFFWSNSGLPMRPPLDEEQVEVLLNPPDPIAGYESRGVHLQSREILPNIADHLRSTTGVWRLYLMGSIRYADIGGAERWMGFCRRFVAPDGSQAGSEGRFVPVENGDYEYED